MELKVEGTKQPSFVSDKDRWIIRQNCLAHADAWLNIRFGRAPDAVSNEQYFEFAEKCEKWVLR